MKLSKALKKLAARVAGYNKTMSEIGKDIPMGSYTKPGSLKK